MLALYFEGISAAVSPEGPFTSSKRSEQAAGVQRAEARVGSAYLLGLARRLGGKQRGRVGRPSSSHGHRDNGSRPWQPAKLRLTTPRPR